jgi:hypothetical protein
MDAEPAADSSAEAFTTDTAGLDASSSDRAGTDAAADGGRDAGAQVAGDVPAATGPNVDRTAPQLFEIRFKANVADPTATAVLADQLGYLDTRVAPAGKLVVHLHGAGTPTGSCGSAEHSQVLAGMGFHVFNPCYLADYGVANCGADIGGCRLEAFEGIDHHTLINVTPGNSIEQRVVKGLAHLVTRNPQGDWGYFLDGAKPRWSAIIISGLSHGASSAGLIGIYRVVDRVVMLSGPLDTNQAWLERAPLTPIDRFYGFTHTGDDQHAGHLAAFTDMNLPGAPVAVDGATAPYAGSHRLVSSAATSDGHGSTQAGGSSPRSGSAYLFLPVWRVMYGR